MQLLKTSLISPKEDFWTTSQENSEAPMRNERNKDEREIGPFNQSIDQLAIIREAKQTNAIRLQTKRNHSALLVISKGRDLPRYITKKVHGGSKTQKRPKGGP